MRKLLRQGADGHEMFLLEQGSVLIHMEQPDEAPFQTVLQAPAIFGEMSLVIHAPRTATVSGSIFSNGTVDIHATEVVDIDQPNLKIQGTGSLSLTENGASAEISVDELTVLGYKLIDEDSSITWADDKLDEQEIELADVDDEYKEKLRKRREFRLR